MEGREGGGAFPGETGQPGYAEGVGQGEHARDLFQARVVTVHAGVKLEQNTDLKPRVSDL